MRESMHTEPGKRDEHASPHIGQPHPHRPTALPGAQDSRQFFVGTFGSMDERLCGGARGGGSEVVSSGCKSTEVNSIAVGTSGGEGGDQYRSMEREVNGTSRQPPITRRSEKIG